MIKEHNSLIGKLNSISNLKGKLNNAVEKIYPEIENLIVTPTEEQQSFNHPNSYGYDNVTVNGIPNQYIIPTGQLDISSNGVTNVKQYETVNVNVVPQEIISKDIDFIDYDGTILYSYTLEEIQNLQQLPALPFHSGLICQGWNYDLQEIKKLPKNSIVGLMYITDDGKTRIYVDIPKERLNFTIDFYQSVYYGVTIDWGDGSPTQQTSNSLNNEFNHKFALPGKYIITLTPTDDCILDLGKGRNYSIVGYAYNEVTKARGKSVYKIEIGKNVNKINKYAFYIVYGLETVTMPNTINEIQEYAFYQCISLKYLALPKTVTTIGNYSFHQCWGLKKFSLPDNLEILNESCFGYDYNLTTIVFPTYLQTLGNYCFNGAYINTFDFSKCIQVPSTSGYSFNTNYNEWKIIVPDELYDEWISTSGWTSLTSYIVKASQYNNT